MWQKRFEAFAAAHREAQKAFNEGDVQTAYANLAPEVEWQLLPSLPDTGVLRGRDAVMDYFAGVRELADWRVEAVEFIDAGEGRIVIRQHGTGTGAASGIAITLDFFQVWELGSDGLVVRVREYQQRKDALKAAGLSE